MIVVFDLDYTLLDTERFKVCLCAALEISLDSFQAHSVSLFSGSEAGGSPRHYDLLEHVEFLSHGDPGLKHYLSGRCESLVHSQMDHFLYPGAISAVQKFRDARWEVHLMTLGSPAFQAWKVSGLTTLEPLLHRKVFVGTRKVDFLKEYLENGDRTLFINDNARESLEILESLPTLRLALIDGGYCHNTNHSLPLFKLDQISPSHFSNAVGDDERFLKGL